MGLLREGINEVIATTDMNAAPMGVIVRNGRHSLVAFLGSHTQQNIRDQGLMVANIIFDPLVYVKTAFDDLPENAFSEEVVSGRTVHRLADAEAWVAMEAEITRTTPEAVIVRLVPLHEEVIINAIHPVCRGFNSVIEATIHATRFIRTKDPGLRDLIGHHMTLARKCGGKREIEAINLLSGYINDKIRQE